MMLMSTGMLFVMGLEGSEGRLRMELLTWIWEVFALKK